MKLWLIILMGLLSLSGSASGLTLVHNSSQPTPASALTAHLEYLPLESEIPPTALSRLPEGEGGWKKLPKLGIVDYQLHDVWLRWTFDQQAPQARPYYLVGTASYTDLIEIYELVEGKAILRQRFGEFAAEHQPQYRLPLAALTIEPGMHFYLMRVASRGPLNLNFTLWDQSSFNEQERGKDSLFLGLLFGLIAAMISYNSFLAIRLRSPTYALYVVYIIGFALVQFIFTGAAFQLLPGLEFKQLFVNQGLIFGAEICAMFAALFSIQFLDLKTKCPRIVSAIKVFFIASTINIFVCIFDFNLSVSLVFLTNAYISGLLLYAGIRRSLHRYRPAYFYTGAWAFIILGSLATMMRIYGYFPDNIFTAWSQFVGGAFEVVLLSLALGDKISLEQERSHTEIIKLNSDLHQANSKLQEHIEDVEATIEEKTRDIRSIMEHIPMGVFMIHRDGTLHKDYSHLLTQIFHIEQPESCDAIDLVFTESNMGADAINQAVNALRASLGENSINFEMNAHLLPSTIHRHTPYGETSIFDLTWNVITDEEDTIDKVLVTVRDVSEMRRLESEARDQKEELEFIGEILNIPAARFLRFIQSCRVLIFENARLIHAEGIEKMNGEVLKLLFINMHTIKGSARSLYLKRMTEIFHGVESYYAHLQKDPQAFWDQGKMERDLEDARRIVTVYETIAKEKLGRSIEQTQVAVFPTFQIKFAYRTLNECLQSRTIRQVLPAPVAKDFAQLRSLFFMKVFVKADEILNDLLGCLPVLAKDLQKDIPRVHLETGGILLDDSSDELFRNIFVHLLRNSMDHGIESRFRKSLQTYSRLNV